MFDNLNTRSVTFNIIMVNVVLFIVCYFIPHLNSVLGLHYLFNKNEILQSLAAGSLDADEFPNLYAFAQQLSMYEDIGSFMPIQIITHLFMHGSLPHIFFNMFGLLMLGSILERVWGAQRYLTFYMITGFGAVVLHVAVQAFLVYRGTGAVDPSIALLESHPEVWGTYFSTTVGASGALFGVLTAFGLLFPNTELYLMFIPIPVKAKYFVTIYILLELYLGISMNRGDNVAHFAHLGGALFGFLLVKYWSRDRNTFY